MNVKTIERFWEKVHKTTTCWIWTGSKRCKGYGAFVWSDGGLVVQGRAHRFSWEMVNGKIPKGMCCLHKCDVPACVNPAHLWLGTKAENNRDMCAKGRHVSGGTHCGKMGHWRKGENHHNTKLDDAQVAALRKDRIAGVSFSKLAKKYSIGIAHAFRICKNQRRTNE